MTGDIQGTVFRLSVELVSALVEFVLHISVSGPWHFVTQPLAVVFMLQLDIREQLVKIFSVLYDKLQGFS